MIKYSVKYSKIFKRQLKIIIKQGKDINKLLGIVKKLANKERLELKYRDHYLYDNKVFSKCRECHIEPDWLLVYKYYDDTLELVLVATGSHSKVLNK